MKNVFVCSGKKRELAFGVKMIIEPMFSKQKGYIEQLRQGLRFKMQHYVYGLVVMMCKECAILTRCY